MSHPNAKLVYGHRLSGVDGRWLFGEFEPGTDANDYVERFTMPWFTEKYDDVDDVESVMADPADVLWSRLRDAGPGGVTVVWPSTSGEAVGEYLLAVDAGARGSEEGVHDVPLPALVGRAFVEDWDGRLERAREILGITFAEPVMPSWFLVVGYG